MTFPVLRKSKRCGICLADHLNHVIDVFSIDSPNDDQLNAAQSGAIAMNLDHELDYLIPRKLYKT